jgi:Zn-dependent protease
LKSSLRVATVKGIGIFTHWTFLVMLAGLFAFYLYQGLSVVAALTGVALITTVFGCVVLHELGHAFMARHYGIPTLDITMYPIGGVARLTRMPSKPKEEFMIAIAGPAVNVAIAGVLYVVNELIGANISMYEAMNTQANVLGMLMWINLGLVVFNMMPAFPMDGGRVFRAALATQMDYRTATHIASLAGQAIAVVFAIYGIVSGMWTLPFVAIFVFIAARQEVQHVMDRT